ncbi:hypothetical protein [Konateibacter massiliensis]|uniref:hypothetical protein n=1 Tax=Konateibacter massiliensis TaxID=2002841 RepID=UPI000C16055F|nr:hypothetical protein [Konateibacter massiliensis]
MNKEAAFQKAKKYIYQNARPLDLARWNYHFEDGSKEEVLRYVKAYQNEDGGFGYGLEPDCMNPNSSPIQTWAATEIIREIGGLSKDEPIIKSIVDYLTNTDTFNGEEWTTVIPSNNDYPHAPWWDYPHSPWWSDSKENAFFDQYNPTATLAGFMLLYANRSEKIFDKAVKIAKRAISDLIDIVNPKDMHVVANFIQMHHYIVQAGLEKEFETSALEKLLCKLVNESITRDTALWENTYACKPSQFFNSRESVFYADNKEIAKFECNFIIKTQQPNGSFDVTWSWNGYEKEWELSKNWWKAQITVNNMIFLKNM